MNSYLKDINQVTDLVWLQTAFLGDIILTTGAIHFVKERYPVIRQHLITTPIGESALSGESDLDSITVFDKKKDNFLSAFRKVKKEVAAEIPAKGSTLLINTHRSFRSSFLRLFLGLPSIGYQEAAFKWGQGCSVPRVAIFHETHRIGLLLAPLGIAREDIMQMKPHLRALPLLPETPLMSLLKPHHLSSVDKGGQKVVAICPGSTWKTKIWPTEKYVDLIDQMGVADENIIFLILGTSDQKQLATRILKQTTLDRCRLLDLVGKTDLADLRRIFPLLDLVITNDSSPIHYASAFDVPTVAIFGSTTPQLGFGPLAYHSRVAEISLSCRPCSDHGPNVCPLKHFQCMRNLEVEVVLEAVKETLHASRLA
jgi:heptosyltransferase II